jgi:hypothetical protein
MCKNGARESAIVKSLLFEFVAWHFTDDSKRNPQSEEVEQQNTCLNVWQTQVYSILYGNVGMRYGWLSVRLRDNKSAKDWKRRY